MSTLTWAMIVAGLAALIAGIVLARPRIAAAHGPARLLLLGPTCSAAALAMFAAEHFFDAPDLTPIVPHYMPFGALFWTYFVGLCLLAAALSFIASRSVALSALLLSLLFLIIVATIDLPGLHKGFHNRFFWILTVRETCFASGSLVLGGSALRNRTASAALIAIGRFVVASAFVFYAIQHFLHRSNVPGVPLENFTPHWIPAPALLACITGTILLLAGPALLLPRTRRLAAATAGALLLALTFFFYLPIFLSEFHTPPLALEGLNYIADTLLFAATALLAGFDPTLTT
jgi:uncharacterized membrane protein